MSNKITMQTRMKLVLTPDAYQRWISISKTPAKFLNDDEKKLIYIEQSQRKKVQALNRKKKRPITTKAIYSYQFVDFQPVKNHLKF